MVYSFRSLALFLLIVCFLSNCKSTEEFTGYSYDPEGVTETSTKKINPQRKHAIGISDDGIWVSNEFDSARLNDFYKVNDTLYQAVITPENAPINNSPWYAFRAWADRDTTVWVQLVYEDGTHRYRPKLSRDKIYWRPIEDENYKVDRPNGTARLRLSLSEAPLWVSAQELRTQQWFTHWADSMARHPFVSRDTVGYSHQQRPVERLTISDVPEGVHRGVVIITSRLHPPEVTGNMAAYAFIEAIADDTPLARRFRQEFTVLAYPFANPDGVQNGHWRHNAGGIDLNRDWHYFNQPEPRAIRDDLISLLKDNDEATVYYGLDFHSTNENIFYPIDRTIETFPDDFTYGWIDELQKAFPNTPFAVEPFPTDSPITKNWIYHTFGADAVTYEVNDGADRDTLLDVARTSAEIIMRQLLQAKARVER